MSAIMDEEVEPREAARDYLSAHPDVLEAWLEGVTTRMAATRYLPYSRRCARA